MVPVRVMHKNIFPLKVQIVLKALSLIGSPNMSNTVLRSRTAVAKRELKQKRIVIIETKRFMIAPIDIFIIGQLFRYLHLEREGILLLLEF